MNIVCSLIKKRMLKYFTMTGLEGMSCEKLLKTPELSRLENRRSGGDLNVVYNFRGGEVEREVLDSVSEMIGWEGHRSMPAEVDWALGNVYSP